MLLYLEGVGLELEILKIIMKDLPKRVLKRDLYQVPRATNADCKYLELANDQIAKKDKSF